MSPSFQTAIDGMHCYIRSINSLKFLLFAVATACHTRDSQFCCCFYTCVYFVLVFPSGFARLPLPKMLSVDIPRLMEMLPRTVAPTRDDQQARSPVPGTALRYR